MGSRGPEPENKISVIESRKVERPKPFSGMTGAAKAVWHRIISDLPADFYSAHELDQLREYCESAARASRATSELKKRGSSEVMEVETKHGAVLRRNPWFDIWKESSSIMSTLGTKLRLNKNSKLSNKGAAKGMSGEKQSSRKGLLFGGSQ